MDSKPNLKKSVAGRVGELAVVCRERVVVGAAGKRSSACGAASCQIMSQVMRLSDIVSSTLVEGAPGATNLTRPVVPSPLHFHTPAH